MGAVEGGSQDEKENVAEMEGERRLFADSAVQEAGEDPLDQHEPDPHGGHREGPEA